MRPLHKTLVSRKTDIFKTKAWKPDILRLVPAFSSNNSTQRGSKSPFQLFTELWKIRVTSLEAMQKKMSKSILLWANNDLLTRIGLIGLMTLVSPIFPG